MGLLGALQTGISGLQLSQRALEVTGNNIANAATPGYSRQRVIAAPALGQEVSPGVFVGTGVQLRSIVRLADEALLSRLRSSVSDQQGSLARRDLLAQVEAIHNELTDEGLGSRISVFFNSFSELANDPTDSALRTLTVQEGGSLADYISSVRADLTGLRNQVDTDLKNSVRKVNSILDQVASLNIQIAQQEAGLSGANGLRDERDTLLSELSEYVDITTIQQPSGPMDVFIGSLPIVLGGQNRGVTLELNSLNNGVSISLRVTADRSRLEPTSGKIGQLMQSRETDVVDAINAIDAFASELIRQVNRLHSQGQSEKLFSTVTGTYEVRDRTVPLNDGLAQLPIPPGNGVFNIHVTQKSTGTRVTQQIQINLNGGVGGTSLNDLAAAIDAVGNLSTSITDNGQLIITSDSPDFEFSFSDDTSGVLASLGINTFFAGSNASDISVNKVLTDDPSRLAVALGHVPGDNRTALAIAGLQDKALEGAGNQSLREYWNNHIEDFAIRLRQTEVKSESNRVVREGLQTQREGISGVNLDEEAISMLTYQRAFQGSARFITVIDELIQTLLGLVG